MTVQEYLSEAVFYGGVITERREMISHLQGLAKQIHPGDTVKQAVLVNMYLAGFDR